MYVKQAESGTETDRERLDNLAEVVSSAAEFEAEYDPEADPMTFPGGRAAADGEPPATPRFSRCSGRTLNASHLSPMPMPLTLPAL